MIREFWALACEFSLWLWIFGTVIFIMSAFPSRDVFNGRAAALWGGVVVFFYMYWIVSMLNA